MASMQGDECKTHGGKRDNSGRKKMFCDRKEARKAWHKCHKRIYLNERIYQSWIDAKHSVGYMNSKCGDSEFAAHLLSLEYRRMTAADKFGECSGSTATALIPSNEDEADRSSSQGILTSTPLRTTATTSTMLSASVELSPILPMERSDVLDSPIIHSNTSLQESDRMNLSLFCDDEGDSDPCSDELNISYKELYNSAIQHLNAENSFLQDGEDESDKEIVMCEDMEGSSSDDESASVFAKPNENENLEEVVASEGGDDVHHSQTKFRRCEDASMLKEEIVLVSEKKFICSLDLLLNVFLKCCQTPGCYNNPEVSHHFIGATLIVNSSCKAGHHHRLSFLAAVIQ